MNRASLAVVALAALLCPIAFSQTSAPSCDELFRQAEDLWVASEYDRSDQALQEAEKICPERAELFWRRARNMYDRTEAIPRDKKPGQAELLARYAQVEEFADRCIALNGKDGECWIWKSVAIGRRGSTQGLLKTVFEVDDMERALQRAFELKPSYRAANGAANSWGDVNSMLGIFYRVLPEWTCSAPFKQIIGTCGDLDKAVSYQRAALAIEPSRIEYHKELGIALLCRYERRHSIADLDEGKKALTDLQGMTEIKSTDPIDKDHAQMALADPSLACGYSRDAQQEQDKEKYQDVLLK